MSDDIKLYRNNSLNLLRSMGILMGHAALVFKYRNKTINQIKNFEEMPNPYILSEASDKLEKYVLNNIKIENLINLLLKKNK